MQFRKATQDDLKEMSQLAAHSFADYIIYEKSVKSTFKTKKDFHRFLYDMHYVQFASFLQKGVSLVGTIDGEIVSIALLESPDQKKITLMDYMKAGGIRMIPYIFKNGLMHFKKLIEQASEKCKDGTPKSWYLSLLAVSKKHQGQNLGSKMINDGMIPFIKKYGGQRLTTNTNNEINVKFYEKNGFVQFFTNTLPFKKGPVRNWGFKMEI